jgi:hypothetical protein
MKKFNLAVIAAFVLFMTSCKTEEVDTNYSEDVVGTYSITEYETQVGESDPSGNDKVIITRESDQRVTMTLDYVQGDDSNDIPAEGCSVAKSGDSYIITRTFSNAELEATVIGNRLTYNIDYNDGDFIILTAIKD